MLTEYRIGDDAGLTFLYNATPQRAVSRTLARNSLDVRVEAGKRAGRKGTGCWTSAHGGRTQQRVAAPSRMGAAGAGTTTGATKLDEGDNAATTLDWHDNLDLQTRGMLGVAVNLTRELWVMKEADVNVLRC